MSRIIKSEVEANRVANEMCEQLGKGWEPRVWENGGWCCCAELNTEKCGFAIHKSTHDHDPAVYSCYASPNGYGGHAAEFGDVPRGDTPEEAFANCICQIGDYLEKVENLYNFGNDQFLAEKFRCES